METLFENSYYNQSDFEDLHTLLTSKVDEPLKNYLKSINGKITSNGYCGAFSVKEGDTYRILPKIDKDEDNDQMYLIFMLLKAYNIKIKNEKFSSSIKNQKITLFDLFADLFANELWSELTKGIFKEYITKQDNLKKLKGKWLINHHISKNFFKEKIYCEYDEFTENNPLNQLFMYAGRNIRTELAAVNKKLKKIEYAFDEVNYNIIDPYLFNYHFHRLNKRFQNSAEMALILLKYMVPNFNKSHKKSFIFLFLMHELFESFIANIVKDLENELNCRVEIQKIKITDGSEKKIKPDITLIDKKTGKAKLIIDTKYKILNKKPSDADIYQMYSYGMSYDFVDNHRKVLLLYPKEINSEVDTGEFKIKGTSKDSEVNIFSEKINLTIEKFEFITFDNYINELKNVIVKLF